MRWSSLLLCTLLLSGCLTGQAELRQSSLAGLEGVWSVTWTVRENGTWDADRAEALLGALHYDVERVGPVLLASRGDEELLRLTPHDGRIVVVTMTRQAPTYVAADEHLDDVVRRSQDAYGPGAATTLHVLEDALGWTRNGTGRWSHATVRIGIA